MFIHSGVKIEQISRQQKQKFTIAKNRIDDEQIK